MTKVRTALDFKTMNQVFGTDDSFKTPGLLMKLLFDKEKRETMFREFLEHEKDLSYDWFHIYFQEEYAERKTKKQDFTPNSVGKLLSKLTLPERGGMYHETAAGTGGIMIQAWHEQQLKVSPFEYYPSNYFYQLEELSDRALPFLLFNLLIRGMNATVVHGDSLERAVKQVYFIQNDADDFLHFSSLNVMPHSKAVKKEFNIRKWEQKEMNHIESPVPEFLKEVIEDAKTQEGNSVL